MFPAEKNGEWEPTKVLQKPKAAINGTTNGGHVNAVSTDIEMNDAPNGTLPHIETEAPAVQPPEDTAPTTEAFEEDPASIEGAAYPLKGGHVEDWTCFFALLTHIYNTLSPPFHTPVLVISQPCWTARDHELLTQFFFETFKIPAFCLMDSALATCYAYGVESATVIDVGHEKCDVTAVAGFVAYDTGRAVAVPGCGGHDMTRRLHELLQQKEFTEDMCEQLKKSPVCEILPAGADMPHEEQASNPAAAASTSAMDSGVNAIAQDGIAIGQVPRGPGAGTEVGQEGGNGDDDDNEGVLDVASIVAKGNASEFLAKREAEKAAKAAAKKAASAEAARPVRLRNAERQTAMFSYQEIVATGDHGTDSNGVSLASRKRKRDVEVGIERFMTASAPKGCNDGVLDTIAATIHNAVLAVPQIEHRSQLWENLIILGNGSRVRGKAYFSASNLWPTTDFVHYRLHPSAALYTIHEIHTLPFQRDHLHIRAPLQLLHPNRHTRDQHPRPRPRILNAPPRRPRRQPPPRRRNQARQPAAATPATQPPSPRRRRRAGPEPAAAHDGPAPQPDANLDQDRQGARVLPRVARPERRGHGGGCLPGRAGRG